MRIGLLVFAVVVGFSTPTFSQDNSQRESMTAVRVERPVELSGLMTDPLWQTASPVTLPFEFQPGENTQAPQRTEAVALYDQDHLYLGFRCFDTQPSAIRANLSDRDKIFSDDYIIIILDTYSDYQRGYELAVNPLGIQGDLMMSTNGEDVSFDMIWESKAAITADGWVAEMKIPFKSLRFPNKVDHTWGLNLVRNIPRDSRIITSWTPIKRDRPNFMTQGGVLKGLRNIHSSGSIEVLPYVLGQQAGAISDFSDPTSAFSNGKVDGRIGGGFRYTPSSDLSLDFVVNPDFSQVESDADQISVNRTFALYYEERRPFFLESQELLQTPMYYSRSINNPLAAGRIVGKSGPLSFMYIGASDRNSVFVVPGEEQSNTVATTLQSFANVGRLRYNFEDEAYVGVMGFARNFSDGHNYVAGFDWSYKFWTNWYFSGEGFLSHTGEINDTTVFASRREFGNSGRNAGLDGERYSGSGIHLVLSRSGRSYGFDAVYNDFSPTYQTYNGLFSSVGYRELYLGQRYSFYWDEGFVERLNLQLSGGLRFNHAGMRKEIYLEPTVNMTLAGQTQVRVSYMPVNDELFRSVGFTDVRRGSFSINSRAWDAFSFGVYGQVGRFIYRSSTPETGDGHNLGASITLRPTSSLKIDLSYDRARLESSAGGSLLYDGYVARTVGIYQFTQEMFLRTILQYNSFSKSFNVYPLFSYKLNALTTFYAGLTNDYLDYGGPSGFTTTDRQFFIKLQYLFRS